MAPGVSMNNPAAADSTQSRIIALVPDHPGALAKITEVLAKAEVNIESISGRSAGNLGVISLTTSDDDAALHALLEAEIRAITSDAVVFQLPDRPGALAVVADLFGRNQVNVRTIHIVNRLEGQAIVAVTTDDDDLARSLLDSDSLL